MNPYALDAVSRANDELELLLELVGRDTDEAIQSNSIQIASAYFADLRERIKGLQIKMAALEKHLESISQELIPTLFTNQHTKSMNVIGVGKVTIKEPWTASIIDKQTGFGWLRQTGNEGLIIETVNAQTLGAFAKAEALAKRPLPADIFKITPRPHVSITAA